MAALIEYPFAVEMHGQNQLAPSSSAFDRRVVTTAKHVVIALTLAAVAAPTSNTGQPVTVIARGLADSSSNGTASASDRRDRASSPSVTLAVKHLYEASGLTWEQLARLFGVSRRAVHNWANGGRMTARHIEVLSGLLHRVTGLAASTPTERRDLLLAPSSSGQTLFEELREEFSPDRPQISGSPISPAEHLNLSYTE